ncbi:MAG: hypothetical protein U0165_20185 [Polyangiaceae bacterium]
MKKHFAVVAALVLGVSIIGVGCGGSDEKAAAEAAAASASASAAAAAAAASAAAAAAASAAAKPTATATATATTNPQAQADAASIKACCVALAGEAGKAKPPHAGKYQSAAAACNGIAEKVQSGATKKADALSAVRASAAGETLPAACK